MQVAHKVATGPIRIKSGGLVASYAPSCVWVRFVVEGGGGGGVSTIKITWADTRATQRRRPGCPVPLLLLLLCRGSPPFSTLLLLLLLLLLWSLLLLLFALSYACIGLSMARMFCAATSPHYLQFPCKCGHQLHGSEIYTI